MSVNWNWEHAKHLLNRAGFGGRPQEIERFADAGLEGSLDLLFDFRERALPEPKWLAEYRDFDGRRFRRLSEAERRELRRRSRRHMRELQSGWIEWMIAAPTPADMLWEKMTFFWHGHFATSFRKVKLPPLLYNQLGLFHRNAVGSFAELLHGIIRDPAMLRYLDNTQNRKGRPNENLARELMELFSLGPGHYTEQDIREAARALTGWAHNAARFRFVGRWHDFGEKTFLGRTGRFDGDDIVDIILEQPACAEFMTRKLLRYFGFGNATDDHVQRLARELRDHDYRLEPVLRLMFSWPEFYAAENVGRQIKSPVQLVVGTARVLQAETARPEFYLYMLDLMGQVPFFPPNVKGWPGGRAWIDTSRLLTRYTFAEILTRGEIPEEIDPRVSRNPDLEGKGAGNRSYRRMMRQRDLRIHLDATRLLNGEQTPEATVARLEEVLLAADLTAAERNRLEANYRAYRQESSEQQALRTLLGDVMTLPAYQVC